MDLNGATYRSRRAVGCGLMLVAALAAPRAHADDTSWDVEPTDRGASWDVDREVLAPDPSWDVPRSAEAPDPSWDVGDVTTRPWASDPGARPSTGPSGSDSTTGASAAADGASAAAASSSVRPPTYMAASTAQYADTNFRARVTPFTGYREVVSLSLAWTKPEYAELELGFFLNPFGKKTTVTRLPPADDGTQEEIRVTDGVMDVGAYLRGSIVYPLFDKRGVTHRPWTGDVLIGLELRTIQSAGDWALLSGLHVGAEFTRWVRSDRGISLGFQVGAPFWDLTRRQSLGFAPIVRTFAGLAF